MSDTKPNSNFRVNKMALVSLAVFIGLLLLARFLLTTGFAHHIVKEKIEAIANESLNGTFVIGELKGDLWKEVLLTNVSVIKDESVFEADTLYAKYEAWSFLSEVHVVNQLKVIGVQSRIEEQNDSVFNVQQLLKESDGQKEESSLSVIVQNIQVKDINTDVYAPSYLPDSTLKIKKLNADAFFKQTDTFALGLSSLSFLIEEGRLPASIKVNSSGSLVDDEITLQEIVIETGRSMLAVNASASVKDSTINGTALTAPFSLADIEPYLNINLPPNEINIRLEAKGSLKDLELTLLANGMGFKNLEFTSGLNIEGPLSLKKLKLTGDYLDISHFTFDSVDAEFGPFRLQGDGNIVSEIPEIVMNWEVDISNIRYEDYTIKSVSGKGELKEDKFLGVIDINSKENERLLLNPAITNVSSKQAVWNLGIDLNSFNLANWLPENEAQSDIFLSGVIDGNGYELSQSIWEYEFSNVDRRSGQEKSLFIDKEEISSINIRGALSNDIFSAKGFATLDESSISIEIAGQDMLSGVSQYTYFIETEEFDVSEIEQLNDFPTSINARIYGEGRGSDPEDCLIFATVKIDSSLINGSRFDELAASMVFSEGVLNISDGVLKSDIAEGVFSGRKNVTDETDPENWLTVDMDVKNVQPLAPLAGAEILNAKGIIKGQVTQDTSGVLRGDMLVDFEDILFDTLFSASHMTGEFDIEMLEPRVFDLNVSIVAPVITGINFQDIELKTNGIANEDTVQAQFDLSVIGSDRGRLIQDGFLTMNIPEEKIDVLFYSFDFITSESRLNLQKPFNVHIEGESISTDTLDLKSTGDAFLKFTLPYADSLEQHAWIEGENFNFGLLQEVVFGKRFLDGILSGDLVFNRSVEDVTGNGQLNLTRVKYEEVEVDSVALAFNIIEERLTANGSLSWENEEKVVGELDVPFVLRERSELDDAFYARPVSGLLTINPSELTKFEPLLQEFGITETEGILSFIGTVSGSAGEPNFTGEFVLDDPVLSGIALDTVLASFQYDNVKGGLEIQSELNVAGQRAASVEVEYPVTYDFREFRVILPEEDEIIKVVARTEDFNIAVFNDFVDEEYLNNLEGVLNADIILEGSASKMIPSGYLKLSDGRVSVPKAGIVLNNLKSDMEFTDSGLNVKSISAKSGEGEFNANGFVSLEGIIPQTLYLEATANQFKLANTSDYNLVIDLEGAISGNARTPKATGKLSVRNGFVFLQDFGENTVEEVQLEGEETSSFSPYDSLAIDMEFEIQKNFYVRNRTYLDMEIELSGELDAQKTTNGELSLFGTLEGIGGYVRPLGKRFDMEEATFTFSGPVEDPDLSIKSRYIPPTRQKGESVELYYLISGTAETPEFSFDSNPQMEESDIVCYTLFGKPCYSLESWQSIFASGETTSATDVLTDVLLDEIEAIATRQLGVDVVQIDNSGANGGTSIRTGWYLNEKTFFAIVNEISGSTPKTLFVLEYILAESWDLIVTQGDDARRGIDIRFQYDY